MISAELFGFWVYFSCLLTRKDTKRNSRKKPFPAGKGFLRIFPKRDGGFRAFDARKRIPPLSMLEPPCFWALAHKNRGVRDADRSRDSCYRNVVSPKRRRLSPTDVILRKAFGGVIHERSKASPLSCHPERSEAESNPTQGRAHREAGRDPLRLSGEKRENVTIRLLTVGRDPASASPRALPWVGFDSENITP